VVNRAARVRCDGGLPVDKGPFDPFNSRNSDDNDQVALGWRMPTRSDTCEIDGCGETETHFSVLRDDVSRRVCRRCAQEMITLHGWSLERVSEHARPLEWLPGVGS
jgi:hypothetical protein